jgi:glycosyltransferase involved in cell wall biosynthesis
MYPATLVIIPACNEAVHIDATLSATLRVVPADAVVVIDDGSHDDTAARARAIGVRVIRHPFNLGYGAALQTGYKYAQRQGARWVVQLDADGQHDPADIPRLLEPLQRGEADLALGSRFVEPSGYAMGATRVAGRLLFQRLLALGGFHIADPTSGYQALSAEVLGFYCNDFFPIDYPDADVLLLLYRYGFRIVEVPVRMAPSPRRSMHAGHAVYYVYKMLLSLVRSATIRAAYGATRPAPKGRTTPRAHDRSR